MWRILTTFGPKVDDSQHLVIDCTASKLFPQSRGLEDFANGPWPRTSTMKAYRHFPPVIQFRTSHKKSTKKLQETSVEDFKLIRLLGSGGFGEAYLARRRCSLSSKSTAVVLKCMRLSKESSSTSSRRRLAWGRREASLMASLYSPYIVRLFNTFEEHNQLVLEMEYCDGGDLRHHLRSQNNHLLPEHQIRVWFTQIASAVSFIHNRAIVHRDIKSKNIFLHDGGRIAKLGDFGTAKCLIDRRTNQLTLARARVGTTSQYPPEFCRRLQKEYGFEVDIYALGVLLFEMATLQMPYQAKSEGEMTAKILRGIRDAEVSSTFYSLSLRRLIDMLMSRDPEDRPHIGEVLSDRFCQILKLRTRSSRSSGYGTCSESGSVQPSALPSKDSDRSQFVLQSSKGQDYSPQEAANPVLWHNLSSTSPDCKQSCHGI